MLTKEQRDREKQVKLEEKERQKQLVREERERQLRLEQEEQEVKFEKPDAIKDMEGMEATGSAWGESDLMQCKFLVSFLCVFLTTHLQLSG